MLSRNRKYLFACLLAILSLSLLDCKAQFKEEAFSQKYNED